MTTAVDYARWVRKAEASRQERKDREHARLVYFLDMCREVEAAGGRLGLLSERTVAGLAVAKRRAEKAIEALEDRP